MPHKPELPLINERNSSNEAILSKPPSYLVQLHPHTDEAGDPYYIGTAYDEEPSEAAREWQIKDNISRPYLEYVKKVSSIRPDLRYLADWMEVATAPPKWRFIKLDSANRARRAALTLVCMLDFREGVLGRKVRVDDISALHSLLYGAGNDHDNVGVRLFVVEDLSRDVVEAFGARFGIDPSFFRAHISDYLWYNTRDKWYEIPDLQIDARRRSFLSIRYTRPLYYLSDASYEAARLQSGSFNVLRRIVRDHNEKPRLDADGSKVGMARSKTSLWIRPNKPNQSGILGILLVDPTTRDGFPLWGGHRAFSECPEFGSPAVSTLGAPKDSIYEEVIFWTSKFGEKYLDAVKSDPTTLAVPALRMVIAEWLNLAGYVTTRLTQIDWELERKDYRFHSDGIDSALRRLHYWRRHLPAYASMIDAAIDRLFADAPTQSTDHTFISQRSTLGLLHDFKAVKDQVEALQERVDRIVAVATATISIEENRRSLDQNELTIAQNRSLTRLTNLATVLIPMSFVGTFFSMTPDVASLSQTYWIFFIIAVPLTAITLVMGDYLGSRQMLKRLAAQWL
ncbi:hypothetical protein F4677DRAFT_417333 [Hypoxylon crocopeplum]|nr:hypothetical protein F4677DRAFT_417333 [Hypoxylon crocopeplum]